MGSAKQIAGGRTDGRRLTLHLAENRGHDSVSLIDQGRQQMFGRHLRMAVSFGELLSGQDRLLRLFGVSRKIHHASASFSNAW